MDMSAWPQSEARHLAEKIDRFDLHRNISELELFGLTVVDAGKTGAAELAGRAFEKILDLSEERSGTRPDVVTGATHADVCLPSLHNIILRDPVFVELMIHPMLLALVTYLLGERCVYAASEVFIKGPTSAGTKSGLRFDGGEGLQLGLHSDLVMHPEPFRPFAEMCNATWLLSDYTRDGGALAFAPGSHRWCRNPRRDEPTDIAVPVEAPMGSLVVWHGNTWHGSYPRQEPGLRTGLAFEFVRSYFDRHHPLDPAAVEELAAAYPGPLGSLLGMDLLHWQEEGPDYAKLARVPFRPTVFT
jgi:hypothetical protein